MSVEACDGQLGVGELEGRRGRRSLGEAGMELSDQIECALVAGRNEFSDELGLVAEMLERCAFGQWNSRHGGPFVVPVSAARARKRIYRTPTNSNRLGFALSADRQHPDVLHPHYGISCIGRYAGHGATHIGTPGQALPPILDPAPGSAS